MQILSFKLVFYIIELDLKFTSKNDIKVHIKLILIKFMNVNLITDQLYRISNAQNSIFNIICIFLFHLGIFFFRMISSSVMS